MYSVKKIYSYVKMNLKKKKKKNQHSVQLLQMVIVYTYEYVFATCMSPVQTVQDKTTITVHISVSRIVN